MKARFLWPKVTYKMFLKGWLAIVIAMKFSEIDNENVLGI